MAIKHLQLLTSTEVADGPFRSLTEVDRYLDAVKNNLTELEALLRQYQTHFSKIESATTEFVVNRDDKPDLPKRGGGVKITGFDKVVVPKLDTLRKNFSVVDELADQAEMLDSLYNTVSVNFRGVRGTNDTLKNIKAMKKSADTKMQAALKFLATVGQKHVPTHFEQMVEATIAYVSPNLTFSKNETYIYAYETKEGHLSFSVYIKLHDLEDDEGSVHPQFYIVFTCVLKPNTEDKKRVDAFYYVTAMPSFSPPGRYPLGKSISDPAKASAALGLILDMENVSTAIGVVPHNLDPDKIKRDKFSVGSMVHDIKVDPDTITFTFLKTASKERIQDAVRTLFMELKAMLAKMRGSRLKVKPGMADGRYFVQFMVTNLAKEHEISLRDIDFLKEHFPQLDDTKIRQVVKVINSD